MITYVSSLFCCHLNKTLTYKMDLILKKTLFNITSSNLILTKHSISKVLMSTGKNVKTPSIPTKHHSNTKALKSSSDKINQDAPKIPKRPLSAFFRYAAEVRSEIVQKNQSLKYSNYS